MHLKLLGWVVSAAVLGGAGAGVAVFALPQRARPVDSTKCLPVLESVIVRCELAVVREMIGDKPSHPGFAFSGGRARFWAHDAVVMMDSESDPGLISACRGQGGIEREVDVFSGK